MLERIRLESELQDLVLRSFPPRPHLEAALAWPQERENGKGAPAPPKLVAQETPPPATTLYVRLPLGGEAKAAPLTAIYLPAAVKPNKAITVILYLHGHKDAYPGVDASIRTYLKHRYWPLREGLNDTGRSFLLVAPTLGPGSEAGKLTKLGGLDWYLNQVSLALKAYADYPEPPAIKRLILAAHSGGGEPMRRLALSGNAAAAAIAECWGFDCFYAKTKTDATLDATEWAEWAKGHPQSKLYVHYLSGTAARSRALAKKGLSNVSVTCSSAHDCDFNKPHFLVTNYHWKDRILAVPP